MTKKEEVALKVFHEICKNWEVSEEDKDRLFGDQLDFDRISNLMTIYRYLHTIFPSPVRANAWPRKPNKSFNGKSALEAMQDNPERVRKYLEKHL